MNVPPDQAYTGLLETRFEHARRNATVMGAVSARISGFLPAEHARFCRGAGAASAGRDPGGDGLLSDVRVGQA
ncbi:MAG: hypothetical protein JXA97_12370 [Anaerolineales bacterium]|nr:hypothetical protein [Anaerolineales bacterium]